MYSDVAAIQVAAYLKGNAVNNLVQSALTSSGTPNILLQTDLDQQATVTIVPDTLPPVVLYEGSFGTTSSQSITLTNTDTNTSSNVNYAVSPGRCWPAIPCYMLRYISH